MLAANVENQRAVSRRNLTKISECIRDGKFVLNGESIIISETGRLMNGQHRILAVINTGIGIWSVVVEGIPDAYFATIDSGKSRSFGDVLHIAGAENTTVLAATVQRLAEYLKDERGVGTAMPISHSELMQTRDICRGLDEHCRACGTAGLKRVVAPSRIAWLHYLVHKECCDLVGDFFDKLASGELLNKTSPILALRNRLILDKTSKTHLSTREVMALLVKAWNAHISKKPLSVLRWSVDEDFPELLFAPEEPRRAKVPDEFRTSA